ncbi:GAF domain-containing protein [Angustibacter aerolatus]
MTDSGRAWRAGQDPRAVQRRLRAAHDRFVATGEAGPGVRDVVAESWARCVRGGLDPERSLAPVDLVDDALLAHRSAHPLGAVMPVIRRLLVDDAQDAGLLVAVSDAAGRLLWVEGERAARAAAAQMHFVEGAVWSEDRAGTNAPGTALALDRPVQIFAAEHLSRQVTRWSCSAAPIHDPDTGAVLGALDLTGGDEVVAPHSLQLVRATVAAVESELKVLRLQGGLPTADPAVDAAAPFAEVLGRDQAVLRRADGVTRLSLRHSELLVLLAAHPEGLTGEQLATALHEHPVAAVTLRAEVARLRGLLGADLLRSRPYRLHGSCRSDADEVRRLLRAGRLGAAVDRYRGPLLPTSDAPEVSRMRQRLHDDLRAALLHGDDPDALLRFADTEHGRMDWTAWQAAERMLPPSSGRREQVRAHLQVLDAELRR